jgi:hypothetical protein
MYTAEMCMTDRGEFRSGKTQRIPERKDAAESAVVCGGPL